MCSNYCVFRSKKKAGKDLLNIKIVFISRRRQDDGIVTRNRKDRDYKNINRCDIAG